MLGWSERADDSLGGAKSEVEKKINTVETMIRFIKTPKTARRTKIAATQRRSRSNFFEDVEDGDGDVLRVEDGDGDVDGWTEMRGGGG